MSSGKNMFLSLRHSTAEKSATPPSVAPQIPSAFAQKKSAFAPPPVRHVSATSPPPTRTSPAVESPPAAPPAPPPPSARPKEKPTGEWAEALYDYSSDVSTSLALYTSTCAHAFMQRIPVIWLCKKMNECWLLRDLQTTGQ